MTITDDELAAIEARLYRMRAEDDPEAISDVGDKLVFEDIPRLLATVRELREAMRDIRDYVGDADPTEVAVEDLALGVYFKARDALAAVGADPDWQRAADEQEAKRRLAEAEKGE